MNQNINVDSSAVRAVFGLLLDQGIVDIRVQTDGQAGGYLFTIPEEGSAAALKILKKDFKGVARVY